MAEPNTDNVIVVDFGRAARRERRLAAAADELFADAVGQALLDYVAEFKPAPIAALVEEDARAGIA